MGGRGYDTLTGGLGADDFVVSNLSELDGTFDYILDFSEVEGDSVTVSGLIVGQYNPLFLGQDDPNDFAQLREVGGDTYLDVAAYGVAGWTTVARIDDVTGLDVDDMVANGSLVL